jgi:glycosyltransferase involved in cell wall biosynthesis
VEQANQQQLKNVVFIENPSDEKVAQELRRSRFFVFPTINEHFGIVTVEAIASGVIPYVHDSGGQKEIVNDPRLRFTDAEFHTKFEQLYHLSPANLNQIREQLHQHIQQFSEASFIEKMLAYLEQPEQEDPVHELQTSALSKEP